MTLEKVIVMLSNPASSKTRTNTPQHPQQMPAMIGSANAIVLIILAIGRSSHVKCGRWCARMFVRGNCFLNYFAMKE